MWKPTLSTATTTTYSQIGRRLTPPPVCFSIDIAGVWVEKQTALDIL